MVAFVKLVFRLGRQQQVLIISPSARPPPTRKGKGRQWCCSCACLLTFQSPCPPPRPPPLSSGGAGTGGSGGARAGPPRIGSPHFWPPPPPAPPRRRRWRPRLVGGLRAAASLCQILFAKSGLAPRPSLTAAGGEGHAVAGEQRSDLWASRPIGARTPPVEPPPQCIPRPPPNPWKTNGFVVPSPDQSAGGPRRVSLEAALLPPNRSRPDPAGWAGPSPRLPPAT